MAEGANNLQIREDIKKGVFLEGVIEERADSVPEIMSVLKKGLENRHIGATNMNVESSRSHSVFSIFLESRKSEGGISKIRKSQFHFVDLAGSERQKKTEARGERLKEGCNINKSLTVLGGVINSLVDSMNGKKVHVRYRDSKLTFLLRDSLGGNSKTAMIANISPAASAYHETLSTLQFAQRAKMIKNKAVKNEDATGDCDALRNEIKRLRDELEITKGVIANMEIPGISSHGSVAGGIQRQSSESEQVGSLQMALDESVVALLDTQAALQCEILRKEDLLATVQKYFYVQQKQEHQYNLVLKLHEGKARREEGIARPLVYQSFDYDTVSENLILKERLWKLENAERVPDCRLVRRTGARVVDFKPASVIDETADNTKIQNELASTAKGKSDMSRRLSVAMLEITKLRQEMQAAASRPSDHDTLVMYRVPPELERELETLKLDLKVSDEDKDTLSRSLDYFKDEFEKQREGLELEITSLKAFIREQETTKGHESMLSRKLIEDERAIHVKQISEMKEKMGESEKTTSILKSALESEKNINNKRKAELSDVTERLQKTSNELADVQQLNDILTSDLESIKVDVRDLKHEKNKLVADKEDISRKLARELSIVENLKHTLAVTENDRDSLAEKLGDKMVQVDHQTLDILDLNSRITYQHDMIADLRIRSQTATSERNKLFRQFNALSNSLADLRSKLETGSSNSIMQDLVEASGLKHQTIVLKKALQDRDRLFSLAKTELESVKMQFRQEMAALKRDYDTLEVDYSKLCVMVELRKQYEKKDKSGSSLKPMHTEQSTTKENNAQLEKQMHKVIYTANLVTNASSDTSKQVFKANINATNCTSIMPAANDDYDTILPLGESQNLPLISDRKINEMAKKSNCTAICQTENMKTPVKSELADKSVKKKQAEDPEEVCLGKRKEHGEFIFSDDTLNSTLKAKLRMIAESNLSADLPEALALGNERFKNNQSY